MNFGSRRYAFLGAAFFGVMTATIYLQAATASISSTYEPTIGWIRGLNPALIFLGAYVAVWRYSRRLLPMGVIAGGAIAAAAIGLVIIFQMEAAPPSTFEGPLQKNLWTTLQEALGSPSFSNRSNGVPLFVMLQAGFLWFVHFIWFTWTRWGAPETRTREVS